METIKSGREISEIFSEGKRFHSTYLTLIVRNQCDQAPERDGRIAFIAGKKQGGAVWRNSAKRRMREIARDLGGPWPSRDVLLVAKRSITEASYEEVRQCCKKMLITAGF